MPACVELGTPLLDTLDGEELLQRPNNMQQTATYDFGPDLEADFCW
jgi:hypothetical protein